MKMGMDIVAKRKCPCPLWGCSKVRRTLLRGDKTMEGIEQSSIPQYLKPLPPKNSRSSDVDGMS